MIDTVLTRKFDYMSNRRLSNHYLIVLIVNSPLPSDAILNPSHESVKSISRKLLNATLMVKVCES